MRIVFLFLVILVINGCSRKVTRVSPDTAIDLSGRWNDTDSRMVADQAIYDLLNSGSYQQYAKDLGRRPVIIVGLIRNRTAEHIDANNFIRKFEVVIHNSNMATLVESEEFRDKLRQERADQQDFAEPATVAQWGKETGADLMLFGDLTSEVDTFNKKRVVNYITTLFLTDIETNRRIWYGQREIKKLVKN